MAIRRQFVRLDANGYVDSVTSGAVKDPITPGLIEVPAEDNLPDYMLRHYDAKTGQFGAKRQMVGADDLEQPAQPVTKARAKSK